ncbi:D-2-hydroxyacid dehydrogenase [Pusillimonas sp. ANT_WB101]|uniref:D-2-hydroxyacid dehydrogenase n=1 Tax=Pusillimonas sp. ANT_WB101 TaxID=2597356 RepID=UPI0011F078C4|nr:D-2-hydroxyacid dehydrogenase [Pusillimonas sp. ANT_WB101]KAA0911330.1 D-2-hydroxyacid dehydrogenase [Pusillimonas sp. ANT_WB101]
MKILFIQRPDVLMTQRAFVEAELAQLDDAHIQFASSPEEALQHRDTEVLVCPTLPWISDVVQGLPLLQWIHFLSAGVDKIWDMPFDKTQYHMSKSIGVHASTITEYVLGAILYILKGFGTFQQQQQRREWRRFQLDECYDKTLAIIGVGSIGVKLAELAKLMGMRVIGTVVTQRSIPGVDKVYSSNELDTVIAQADFVVLLAPLTAATQNLIDTKAFEAMKGSAWLINVARGELVDQSALINALLSKQIAGAVLDVFDEEPLVSTSKLWGMDNVLITPHVAGTTQHYMFRALEIFKDNYRSFRCSGKLTTPISIENGY